jgi:hypothetical protein
MEKQMAKKAPKRNVGGKSADLQAARELELYIDNDGELYRRQYVPIQVNLIKKKLAGTYDQKKAPKLFEYLAEAGAKKYAREFGGTWHVMFDVPTRKAVAKEYASNFAQQYRSAELDHLVTEAAPAAYKGMPGSQIRKIAEKKGKLPKVKSRAAAAKALLANPKKTTKRNPTKAKTTAKAPKKNPAKSGRLTALNKLTRV